MCLPFFHKWKIHREEEMSVHRKGEDAVIAYVRRLTLVCEKCGTVKFKQHRSGYVAG